MKQSAKKTLAKTYQHPIPQAILAILDELLPPFAATRKGIEQTLSYIQKNRRETFLNELAKGQELLTENKIQTEEFIHSLMIVYKAAINTYQREKIRRFARLLLNTVAKEELASDKFESFVKILDDLSETELNILETLRKLEIEHPPQPIESSKNDGLENMLQRASRFWLEFENQVWKHSPMSQGEFQSHLSRLNRTGLYRTYVATAYSNRGDKGHTTLLYAKFREWIILEEGTDSILYPDP